MSLLTRTRSFVRNLVGRSRVEQALDDELKAYLHLLEDEYVAGGLEPEAARRAARVELGGAEQVKARVRDVRTGALLDVLAQDVRYAVRTLRRAPAFTAVTIAALALGIGANTAVFSILDALLFRPLPIADPDRVVALYRGTTGSNNAFSYLDYLDYRAGSRHFDGVAAWGGGNRAWFRNGGDLERVDVQIVSGNYFDVLGVGAPAGRTFTAADDDFAAPRAVAVISDGLWRTKFGADPAVAGRAFTLSGQTFTVIGRAPAGFKGMVADAPPDLWVPCAAVSLLEPGWNIRDRREIWMSIAARLRPGTDLREAEASLQPVAARIGLDGQGDAGASVRLIPAGASVFDPDARASSLRIGALLMGIVGFVLLIACANVAGLVLARGAARARELGVRLAIGASRGRVVRQVVTESLLLALAGGAAGLLVAIWTAQVLVALAPPDAVPQGLEIALDVRVMAFAALLSLATGVLFGAAPAWQLSRADPVAVMKGGGQADRSGGRSAVRMRRAAVVAQIALSVVLLVMAALFVRTLSAARAVPSGYEAGKVLLVTIDFSVSGAEPAGSLRAASGIIDRVAALPGVDSASFGQIVPFSGSLIQRPAVPEGKPATDDDMVAYNVVGEGYFRTLGLMLRGRDFRPADTEAAPRVAVINETLARRLWPGANAIGRRLQLPLRTPGPAYEVIGVVSDGRYVSLTEAQRPFLYLPVAQNFRPRLTLHVRTSGPPAAFVTPVRSAVRSVSVDLPVYNPVTLDEYLARSLARARLIARLLTAFGGMALLVAAVGIYGFLAFAVARRTREMGVRMALGARSSDLVRMVLRQSAGLVAIGLGAGVACALLATRLVKAFVFGVPPTDPAAFAAAVIILCAVALVATTVPARRATHIDPLTALRSE